MVGDFTADAQTTHAFRWHDGTTELLSADGFDRGAAAGVNEGQQVAGSLYNGSDSRPVVWSASGQPRLLPTFGGTYTNAVALNDQHLVVGVGDVPGGATHALAWLGNRLIDLGALPTAGPLGASYATSVEPDGRRIVGASDAQSPLVSQHATLWALRGGRVG